MVEPQGEVGAEDPIASPVDQNGGRDRVVTRALGSAPSGKRLETDRKGEREEEGPRTEIDTQGDKMTERNATRQTKRQ